MYLLEKQPLFATPDSSEDLIAWILALNQSEQNVAMTVLGMTWNLAAEITKTDHLTISLKEKEDDEV